jgi:hypothetical protein
MFRMPPPPLPKHGKRPATIIFPEDELMKKYYARHPEVTLCVLFPCDVERGGMHFAGRFYITG